MASTDEPQSLRTALEEAESRRRLLESSPDATSPSYASDVDSVLTLYARVLDQISSVALFSPNEGLEDVATSSLPYMLVNFTVAELVQRTPFTAPARRTLVLRAARDAYERFLSLADAYGLVSGPYAKLLERYRDDADQFAVVSTAADATSRRAAKIASSRADKALREKLDLLRRDARIVDRDDEAARDVYLADVAWRIHQAFQGLEGLNREAEMLAMAPPELRELREESLPRGAQADDASARLDRPLLGGRGVGAGGPLLSREGRPLQPFTLLGSRAELARGVFRPGHNLPTMSIDEYLAEEKRRGNILEGGTDPPRVEVDDDDMDAVDRETYKAREWDDFKDDNRRGAGNTLNVG